MHIYFLIKLVYLIKIIFKKYTVYKQDSDSGMTICQELKVDCNVLLHCLLST